MWAEMTIAGGGRGWGIVSNWSADHRVKDYSSEFDLLVRNMVFFLLRNTSKLSQV